MQQKKEEKKSRNVTKISKVNTGFRMDKALFELVERNYPQRTEGIIGAVESDLKVMREEFDGVDLLSGWSESDKSFILIISGIHNALGYVFKVVNMGFASRPQALQYGKEYLKNQLNLHDKSGAKMKTKI